MKLLAFDWGGFLAHLAAWERLSPPARRALLDRFSGNLPVDGKDLGRAGGELLESGLVSPAGDGRRLQLGEAYRPLLRGLRALARLPLFDEVSPANLERYLETHFSHAECIALMGSVYGGRKHVAEQVGAKEWLESFQQAPDPAAWERARCDAFSEMLCFAEPTVAPALRAVLERLLASGDGPCPIGELARNLPALPPQRLAKALFAGARYLLLFTALRGADLEALVGLWPPLARRLLAPPAPPPNAVEPEETLSFGLVEDLVAVLAVCAAEPPRVRADDLALFARARDQIVALLPPLPAWAEEAFRTSAKVRADRAAWVLSRLGCTEIAVDDDARPRLASTRQGRGWLEQTAKGRLKHLLDRLRETAGRPRRESSAFPFLPEEWSGLDLGAGEAGEVIAAFTDLAPGVFFDLAKFLRHRRELRNPLLERGRTARSSYYPAPTGEQLEALWERRLTRFLAERLILVGGIRLGRAGKRICFALNDVGRYLLGAADDFELDEGPAAEIVVQPNFEVVFLTPSITVEAAFARFAERRGTGLGTLFRITRRSVLAAAASGLTAEQALATLRQAASKGVPDNVLREVAGWFAQTRRITLRPAVLLHCPDRETAARVLAAGGKDVAPLTETVVELRAHGMKATLLRKLREMGVFASE